MNKQELINTLLKVDEETSLILSNSKKIAVVIGGGSVLLIKDLIDRQTIDIDTLGSYEDLESLFNKYEMNSRMNAFSDSLPENYENRLEKIPLPTKALDYYMLSVEDLVIMKLFSNRDKDHKDITGRALLDSLNWDLLQDIVDSGELSYTFNERRYKEFLDKFQEYVKENQNK